MSKKRAGIILLVIGVWLFVGFTIGAFVVFSPDFEVKANGVTMSGSDVIANNPVPFVMVLGITGFCIVKGILLLKEAKKPKE